MARGGKLYLKDILDSINSIESYVRGLSFKEFSGNKMATDAVVRNFEIIGEAAKNISSQIKSEHKQIPWKEMAGMRDKITHEYFGIDLKIVWKTIKRSLPDLKRAITPLLKNLR
ncbi:MAG: DUF86 domain-containing protein [Candidatus Omnitrophica bacterium]|nr:DUF86 domain-containing protein [Candidatus Omnitrophota bacterium]